MKKELEVARQEIRKLKRENGTMYKEIEICSHVFLNAEQHHTGRVMIKSLSLVWWKTV